MTPTGRLRSVDMAQRLLTASLNLEEDANIFAIAPTDRAFHAMLLSMREMHTALTESFREIALR